MISPMIEELAMSFAGQAKVGKLNIDNYVRVATQYRIKLSPPAVFQTGSGCRSGCGCGSQASSG